jgi:drug/metabolite transporter (DMT)-like permease
MHRLPTQFDTQAARRDETAAAGGSTSTTCSSCIVTLGTTSVLTSMYFSALGKKELPVPATPEKPARKPPAWKLIGFFLPLSTLLLSGFLGAMAGATGEAGVVVGVLLGLLVWVGAFVCLHRRIGKSAWGGVLAGVIGLVLFCGGVVLEVMGWLGAL